jgi:neurotransmitter:Na+ symporter, NSS family
MPQVPREQWGSRAGFVLAAVGSAVGLGNMWRFSYLTAENGGAAFLILYVVMVAIIGLPILLAELAVGRGARLSPVGALAHYGGPRWKPLGVLFVVTGFVILAYYAVISGWVIRYAGTALLQGFPANAGEVFGEISTGPGAVLFQVVFMAVTIAIVMGGVRRGIERTALILMPVLFLTVAGLAIYATTLEGAAEGYRFYLSTDFREILSLQVLSHAAGQAFFSLSLGMGAMLTFASYLSREDDLPRESLVIAGSDFLVAFVAGLMTFPIIFALGLSALVSESTVGALFIGLPEAFATMGPTGRVVGFLFFGTLLVGALTSALSLLEVVVATAMDSLGWTRRMATLAMGAAITLVGIPAAFSLDVLSLMDQLAGTVLIIVGALFISLFVGWRMPDPVAEVRRGTRGVEWFGLWRFFLRWVAPAFLLLVAVYSLGGVWQEIRSILGI